MSINSSLSIAVLATSLLVKADVIVFLETRVSIKQSCCGAALVSSICFNVSVPTLPEQSSMVIDPISEFALIVERNDRGASTRALIERTTSLLDEFD